ncbi:MAG: 50S ribosomal protein L11 methyltransferase [Myxococcales bacterium]|nr:50S ribosomal protein L11 methyltransferase [Myxococcales bacterium]
MTGPSARPVFPFLHIDVDAAAADEASALLFELGALGVEERDASTLVKGAAADTTTLVASFGDRAAADLALAAIDESLNPRIEEIVGDEWRDEWKKHFKPFALCDDVVVRPPWEAYEGPHVPHVLELEPGRAFGTGLHETTSLVATILAKRRAEVSGHPLLDVGCGSGILAIVGLVFGAKSARAIDNDPDVIPVAKENAERNGLSDKLTADTTSVEAIHELYPVVVANIEADVLIRLAPALLRVTASGGLLVLSGILVPQADRVRAAFPSLTLEEGPVKGEWTALAFRKK